MRTRHIRGGSVVELALIVPFIVILMSFFWQLGLMGVRQIQLENLASRIARDMATSGTLDVPLGRDIVPSVEIMALPSLPRTFPRNNSPLKIVAVTLRRPFNKRITLQAHAREVML